MRIRFAITVAGCLIGAAGAYANLPPPEDVFSPGFTVTYADDRPVVEAVEPDSPAAKAGIEPGYRVLAIADLDALMQPAWSLTRALHGFEGTNVSVIVSDPAGNVTVHILTRSVEQ